MNSLCKAMKNDDILEAYSWWTLRTKRREAINEEQ